jgi:hypothetical protein
VCPEPELGQVSSRRLYSIGHGWLGAYLGSHDVEDTVIQQWSVVSEQWSEENCSLTTASLYKVER